MRTENAHKPLSQNPVMPSPKMYQPTSPFSQPMKQFSQSRAITEASTRGRVTECKTTARASCSAGHKHLVTEKKVQQLSAIERQNTRQHGRASNRFAVNGGGWPTRQLPPAGAVSRLVHASNPSSQSLLALSCVRYFSSGWKSNPDIGPASLSPFTPMSSQCRRQLMT